MKRVLFFAAVLALFAVLFSGCAANPYNYDYKEDVTEYAMIAQSGDLAKLSEYPNLTYVDLRGSTCYDEILDYAKANPQVTVRYSVQLGPKRFNQDVTEVKLNGYEISYSSLADNLKYLPDVKLVHIDQIELSAEELQSLQNAYPEIQFTYTVEIKGQRYEHTVTELDLSRLSPADVPQAIDRLRLLSELTDMHVNGSCFSEIVNSPNKAEKIVS